MPLPDNILKKIDLLLKKNESIINEIISQDCPLSELVILQQELQGELQWIQSNIAASDFKDLLKERCQKRSLSLSNSSVPARTLSTSLANELYSSLLNIVFEPKTMAEFLRLFLPSIKSVISITIETPIPEGMRAINERRTWLKNPPLRYTEDKLETLSAFFTLDFLNHCVIADEHILDLNSLSKVIPQLESLTAHQVLIAYQAIHAHLSHHYPALSAQLFDSDSIWPYELIECYRKQDYSRLKNTNMISNLSQDILIKNIAMIKNLSQDILTSLLKTICPENLNDLVVLLRQFPADHYQLSWENINISQLSTNKLLPADYLVSEISKKINSNFFSPEQQEALLKVLVSHIKKGNNGTLEPVILSYYVDSPKLFGALVDQLLQQSTDTNGVILASIAAREGPILKYPLILKQLLNRLNPITEEIQQQLLKALEEAFKFSSISHDGKKVTTLVDGLPLESILNVFNFFPKEQQLSLLLLLPIGRTPTKATLITEIITKRPEWIPEILALSPKGSDKLPQLLQRAIRDLIDYSSHYFNISEIFCEKIINDKTLLENFLNLIKVEDVFDLLKELIKNEKAIILLNNPTALLLLLEKIKPEQRLNALIFEGSQWNRSSILKKLIASETRKLPLLKQIIALMPNTHKLEFWRNQNRKLWLGALEADTDALEALLKECPLQYNNRKTILEGYLNLVSSYGLGEVRLLPSAFTTFLRGLKPDEQEDVLKNFLEHKSVPISLGDYNEEKRQSIIAVLSSDNAKAMLYKLIIKIGEKELTPAELTVLFKGMDKKEVFATLRNLSLEENYRSKISSLNNTVNVLKNNDLFTLYMLIPSGNLPFSSNEPSAPPYKPFDSDTEELERFVIALSQSPKLPLSNPLFQQLSSQTQLKVKLLVITTILIDNLVEQKNNRYLAPNTGSKLNDLRQFQAKIKTASLGSESEINTCIRELEVICAKKRNILGLFQPHSTGELVALQQKFDIKATIKHESILTPN